ncbi:MAG: glutamine synthetase beta-grasp domain-containing protein [Nanoarchaeota archaeon]|nr:glutamine synthetase beta-grasp domain-containing protein [Nanoarchaeota archaeon]
MKVIAEYIWLDGNNLTEDKEGNFVLDANKNQEIRSKTKILDRDVSFKSSQGVQERQIYTKLLKNDMPIWGFDGSSTNQAKGHKSDCVLKPVRVYVDPLRTRERPDYLSVLVLNEVYDVPGEKPHLSNMRARLRELSEKYQEQELFRFGLEQEYTFMRVDENDFSRITKPLGFPRTTEEPLPQGKYYCGNGADKIVGREIVEEHMFACLDAGIVIAGTNGEVMPGQGEYQAGRGDAESDPLRVADDLITARYLMSRIGEKYSVVASLEAKPQKGDWNGAGAHTNFSTKSMRESDKGFQEIIERLRHHHPEHIAVYGEGIEERLTGKHETCPYTEFRAGVSDRGASIRIPWQVAVDGKGYMEDRRPCANMNPYVVLAKIMETVMEG